LERIKFSNRESVNFVEEGDFLAPKFNPKEVYSGIENPTKL
jgi:hypothetical protein